MFWFGRERLKSRGEAPSIHLLHALHASRQWIARRMPSSRESCAGKLISAARGAK
jgi:hypothetical protein